MVVDVVMFKIVRHYLDKQKITIGVRKHKIKSMRLCYLHTDQSVYDQSVYDQSVYSINGSSMHGLKLSHRDISQNDILPVASFAF